jgi:hypothetical protein
MDTVAQVSGGIPQEAGHAPAFFAPRGASKLTMPRRLRIMKSSTPTIIYLIIFDLIMCDLIICLREPA